MVDNNYIIITMVLPNSQWASPAPAKMPGLRAAAQWHHAEDIGQDLNKTQKVAKNGAAKFFGQCQCILTSPESGQIIIIH